MKAYNFSSLCLKFRHESLLAVVMCLTVATVSLEKSPTTSRASRRGPASLTAAEAEVSAKLNPNYNKYFFNENSGETKQLREQLQYWQANEENARHMGMETNPLWAGPDRAYKTDRVMTLLKRNMTQSYLDPIKDSAKEWWDDYRSREERSVIHGQMPSPIQATSTGITPDQSQPAPNTSGSPAGQWKVKIRTKITNNPTLVFNINNPFNMQLSTSVSASGKGDIQMGKSFANTGFDAKMRHDFSPGMNSTTAQIDQRIVGNLKIRAASIRTTASESSTKDDRLQLVFGKAF